MIWKIEKHNSLVETEEEKVICIFAQDGWAQPEVAYLFVGVLYT